jgi:hypothetical protein
VPHATPDDAFGAFSAIGAFGAIGTFGTIGASGEIGRIARCAEAHPIAVLRRGDACARSGSPITSEAAPSGAAQDDPDWHGVSVV